MREKGWCYASKARQSLVLCCELYACFSSFGFVASVDGGTSVSFSFEDIED